MPDVEQPDPPPEAGVLFDVPTAVALVDDEWLARHPEPCDPDLLPVDEHVPSLGPVDWLDWAEAEPSFATAVALLDGVDPAGLSEADRVRFLTLADRLSHQAEALRLAAVAVVAGPEPTTEEERFDDFADCDVAAALHLSAPAARHLVHWTRHLAANLPQTRRLLAAGVIGFVQARIVAETTLGVDPILLPRIERLALTGQAVQSPGRLRAAVTKAVARVDAAGHAARERAARQDTEVRVWHEPDGVGGLYGVNIPSLDLAVIQQGMDAYARSAKAQGDGRTLGQLHAAALAAWAADYLTGPGAPTNHGRPVTVQVTIDLPTLLGLTDQPADVTGGGLIPAHVARAALQDATLRRLIIDPATGHLLDYGRTTYRVPPDLAAAINARYVTTTGPGSCAPARSGDQDHSISYAQGGPTSRDNLHPPGRRWHGAKTKRHWTTKVCECGTVIWTSTKGATCRVDPHDYRLGP